LDGGSARRKAGIPAQDNTNTERFRHTSMSQITFEPMIIVFKEARISHFMPRGHCDRYFKNHKTASFSLS
jgi:hypothetical protein